MKKKLIHLLILLVMFSCKEEAEPPTCSCNGPTWMSIPNEDIKEVPIEEQKSGFIFFKDAEILDQFVPDERWEQRFWIFQGTEGCHNCQRKFIVCNEEFLNTEFDFLKGVNNSDSIRVSFEGNLMIPCGDNPFIAPGDFFYAEIVLTSIKKMN